MRYLYFDCFAGFDLSMILGAFVDMGTDVKTLEKYFLPGVTFSAREEKRMGMEAVCAYTDSVYPSETVCIKRIEELIDGLGVSAECENCLKKYISILKDVRCFEPEDAEFDISEQSVYISVLCAIWNEARNYGIEKIYISPVFTSSEDGLFGPYTKPETVCVSKKYDIDMRYAGEYEEIFSVSASAMLAAIGAESVSGFVPSSVVKIGYGAGKSELQTLPNILRVVIGEGNSDSVMFSAEEIGADFCRSDYAVMKES